jgi:hypothetical protein
MTKKLITKYDATDEVWFAYDNPIESESTHIGQGDTQEAACTDYWYQVKGDAADLFHDDESDSWYLSQGCWRVVFGGNKQEALDFADANEWQIKGRWA